MSVERTTAVWEGSRSTGNDRLCLLALADAAHDDGYAWPGIDTLAEQTRVHRCTIIRCLARLERLGELIIDRNRRRGNRYLVVVGFAAEKIQQLLQTLFGWSEEQIARYRQRLQKLQTAPAEKSHRATSSDRSKPVEKLQAATSEVAPVQHQKSQAAPSEVAPVRQEPSGTGNLNRKEPLPPRRGDDPRSTSNKPTPRPAKSQRSEVYDALAEHVFELTPRTPAATAAGGRIGPLVAWCFGSDVHIGKGADRRTIPGCDLPVTAARIRDWVRWWQREHPDISVPRGTEKFVQHFYPWLEKVEGRVVIGKQATSRPPTLEDWHKKALRVRELMAQGRVNEALAVRFADVR